MEVIVSAAVLILVVLGVLAAMDAVSGTAGANQARTVAAALAEDDQESLRAMATEDLERLQQVRPSPRYVQVGEVTYTIHSEARWVTDAGGEEASCALDNGEGSYLRITSTVTSPITGAKVKPVVLSSIVAPRPGAGTLAAKVVNAEGVPVSGADVHLAGPKSASGVTNEVGCAVFTGLDAGTYNVSISEPGWTDESSNEVVVKTGTVTAGNITIVEFVLAEAASLDIEVYTIKNGVEQSDLSRGVIAANEGVTAGFLQRPIPPPPVANASSFDFDSMFPFTSPYTLFSGTCLENDPSKLIPTYFDANRDLVVTLTPGLHGGTKRVLEPAVDVHVRRGSGDRSGARVFAYPKPEECGGRIELTGSTSSSRTGSDGRLPNDRVRGLPFGIYDFCAQYTTSGDTYHALESDQKNMTPAGMLVGPINIPSSNRNGSCP